MNEDTRENLSGNHYANSTPLPKWPYTLPKWIEEMHEVAVGIESEGKEWKERMDKLTKEKNDGQICE